MTNVLDSEIRESLLLEKCKSFFNRYKYYIFVIGTLIVISPLIYESNNLILKKKNSEDLELFVTAKSNLNNQNIENARQILDKLAKNSNDIIKLLAINELLLIEKNSSEKEKFLNNIIKENKIKKKDIDLLKIKSAILIFDNNNENAMLIKLNNINKNLENLSKHIMYDYYLSNNQLLKAEEFKK